MVHVLKNGHRIATRQDWTGKYEKNAQRLLTAHGYARHAETSVERVVITTPHKKQRFNLQPETFVEMAYMEYCHYLVPGFKLLDEIHELQDIKNDATLFFAHRWWNETDGFVAKLRQATDIDIQIRNKDS